MVLYSKRAEQIGWGVVIITLLLITIMSAKAYPYIVGEQHLNQEKKEMLKAALNKPCNGRIILITTMPHPKYNGWALGPLIRIYSIHKYTSMEFYCLMRHECLEPQIWGEHHTWKQIIEECNQ